MVRGVVALILAVVVADHLAAQAPAPAAPAFEVASVKLDPKQLRGGSRRLNEISLPALRVRPGGLVESYGHTLRNLIAVAYDLNLQYQKIEAKTELLEIELVISAKAPGPDLSAADAKLLLRALLEERFRLRWRWQPREIDGYVLLPSRDDARPGSGLRPFTEDCASRAGNTGVRFESADYEQKARCGWTGINARQRAIGQSMTAIAERLTMLMAAPVSDRTGWTGLFSFDVQADTRDMPFNASIRPAAALGAPTPSDAPQLLEVLRRELGLKLEKNRVSTQDFIIEQIEPLIEN